MQGGQGVASVADVPLMTCKKKAEGLAQVIRGPRMVWPQEYEVIGS